MRERDMHCTTCQAETLFEVPPCADGHGDDCPELVCTDCGGAVLIAPVTIGMWLRPRGPRVAARQRRAA